MRSMLHVLALLFLSTVTSAQEPRVRNVAVFLYPGVELLDFAGPSEVFSAARAPDGSRFRVYTVAESKEPIVSQRFLRIEPSHDFDDCPKPDIVVLPGGGVPLSNERVVEWVRSVSEGTEVTMSVCNGALLLARAKLLDGLEATTHHGAIETLMFAAPSAKVLPDRRFVDNGHIVTSAGVSAGIDGALHVVARLLGEDSARQTARYMEYRWEPETADAYQKRVIADAGRTPAFRLAELLFEKGEDAALREWQSMEEPPTEAEINRIGYALLDGQAERALLVFSLNAKRSPDSPNVWDSLGDAYAAVGHGDDAVACARKAIALLETADVEQAYAERILASAREKLERLGKPDFRLKDVDGREYRLADLRGKIVVLEWTSDVCPAVAGFHDSGERKEIRAALGDRVEWLAIDSSHFCAERRDEIRAFREKRGMSAPYLLDASGEVGRAFGATMTPEMVVVGAKGEVEYVGAPQGVVAAVEALAAGREVETRRIRPRGCTIKYSEAWVCPPCGVDCHDEVYDGPGNCKWCGMTLIRK